MDNWDWEQTTEHCPKCNSFMLFADDPESDTWNSTGVYKCEKCGFRADQTSLEGMDGGDFEQENDVD